MIKKRRVVPGPRSTKKQTKSHTTDGTHFTSRCSIHTHTHARTHTRGETERQRDVNQLDEKRSESICIPTKVSKQQGFFFAPDYPRVARFLSKRTHLCVKRERERERRGGFLCKPTLKLIILYLVFSLGRAQRKTQGL